MRVLRSLLQFCIGGLIWLLCELLWDGQSHWTMCLVGGLCFLGVGAINEVIPWTIKFWKQVLIGGFMITLIEFISGCILNIWLGLGIWDYSDMPFNLFGQICLPFSILWLFLAAVIIIADDWYKYFFWGEEKPYYTF